MRKQEKKIKWCLLFREKIGKVKRYNEVAHSQVGAEIYCLEMISLFSFSKKNC